MWQYACTIPQYDARLEMPEKGVRCDNFTPEKGGFSMTAKKNKQRWKVRKNGPTTERQQTVALGQQRFPITWV
jgi:hypothetical protein